MSTQGADVTAKRAAASIEWITRAGSRACAAAWPWCAVFFDLLRACCVGEWCVQILKNSLEYIKGELNLQDMVITKWPPAPEVLPTPSPHFPTPASTQGVEKARGGAAPILGDDAHAVGPEPRPSLHVASHMQ